MGAPREKDQADFDLERFVDLFDTAMSSDNPTVQRAFKNLLLVASIVNAEDPDAGMRQGPLRRVIEDQRNMLRRLVAVEDTQIYPQTPSTPYGPTSPASVPLGPYVAPNTGPYLGTGIRYTTSTGNVGVQGTTIKDPILLKSKYEDFINKFK